MSKKLIWIIVGLVVIIGVIIGLKKAGVIGKEEGIKVTAEAVQRRTIIETVNASGKVYPEIEVKISPDISGEIVELNVEEGDSVKKGQILATLDLTEVQAGLNQSKLAYEKALRDHERAGRLYRDSVATLEQFQNSKTALDIAQQQLFCHQLSNSASEAGPPSQRSSVKTQRQPAAVGVRS